jgi:hypothetical protein
MMQTSGIPDFKSGSIKTLIHLAPSWITWSWNILALFIGISVCSGQITYVGSTTAPGATVITGSGNTMPFTYTATSGNTVMFASTVAVPGNFPYCLGSDNTTAFPASQISAGSFALGLFTATATSTSSPYGCAGVWNLKMGGILAEFSGVLSVNNLPTITSCGSGTKIANGCSGTGSTASMTLTLDDANDVMGCAFVAANGTTFTPVSGTSIQTLALSVSPYGILLTTTASSPGSVTCSATLSTSGAWLGAPVELRTVASTPLFAQITPSGYSATGGTQTGLLRSQLYGSFQVHATIAGHGEVILYNNDEDSGNGIPITFSAYGCNVSPTTCALSANACTSANAIDTYLASPSCQGFGYLGGSSYQEDAGANYILSGAGGVNCITPTRSGNPDSGPWTAVLHEFNWPITVDSVAHAGNNSPSNTNTMTATSPTGTDAILQIYSGAGPAVISGPVNYLATGMLVHTNAFYAYSSNGTAPTETATGPTPSAAGCGFAAKLSTGTSAAASQIGAFVIQ